MGAVDPTVVISVLGAAVVAFLLAMHRSHNRTLQSNWREAARALGMTRVATSGWFGNPRLAGMLGPYELTVCVTKRSLHERTVLTLSGAGRFPADIELRRETLATTANKLLEGQDVLTGDEAFDREVLVRGREAVAAAVLDARARRMIVEAVRRGIVLSGSTVTMVVPDLLGSAEEVKEAVQSLRDLAKLLTEPSDPAESLLANLKREPLAPVRLRLVHLFRTSLASAAQAGAAIRLGLDDPDPTVRLEAASQPGSPPAVLQALATSPSVEDGIATQAVRTLGSRAPLDWTIGLVSDALDRGRSAVVEASVEVLGHLRNPAAEPALVDVLERGGTDAVRAAVTALAKTGTVAAVPALRRVASASLRHLGLQLAAKQAIASIQARTEGAFPGQLALADQAEGAVSIAERSSGSLSLGDEPSSEDEDGRRVASANRGSEVG